jgi:putative tricarboxylic transport membrane protein
MVIRRETVSSFVLVLSGAFFLVYGLAYPLDQWANPGPGVFPLMVGAVWVILALYQLIRSFRIPGPVHETTVKEKVFHSFVESKPLFMIIAFVIYLTMVRWVGFFVSTFLFVIVISRLFGGKGWVRPIALSTGVNVFCYFLFEVWLKLSFPAGFLF